jgi:hypothetical protein
MNRVGFRGDGPYVITVEPGGDADDPFLAEYVERGYTIRRFPDRLPDATLMIPPKSPGWYGRPEWIGWIDALVASGAMHWFDNHGPTRVRMRVWLGDDRAAGNRALLPFVEAARVQ